MVIGDTSKKANEEKAAGRGGLGLRLDSQDDAGEKQFADNGLQNSLAQHQGLSSSSSTVDGSTGVRSDQLRNRQTDQAKASHDQVYRWRGCCGARIVSDLIGLRQYVANDWARDVSEADMDLVTPNVQMIPDLQVVSSVL
jgi:hypothetical protein